MFSFTEENLTKASQILAKYPENRKKSAVMPIIDLAQRQNENHLSKEVIIYIAQFLGMTEMAVYEVASFYSMYNLKPVGKYLLQFCKTTPCMLCGSDDILQKCKDILGIKVGETTPDGLFTIREVECLGACVAAPVVQVNDDYHEKLDKDGIANLIDDLKREHQQQSTNS